MRAACKCAGGALFARQGKAGLTLLLTNKNLDAAV